MLERREALTDQVAAIEAVAQQPKADQGRVSRLVKRLGAELKTVGLAVGTGLLEAYAKQKTGLP